MDDQGNLKVIELLLEAEANERSLVKLLESHLRQTDRGSYKLLLEAHLRETKSHADRIGRRLQQLGYRESLLGLGVGAAQNLVKQGLGLAKTPVDMVRGRGDSKETMLRNARDEVMTEGLEIATYDAIESLARAVGDNETAELAAEIRVDEEQMFDALRKEIPVLSDAFARSEIPVEAREIEEPWIDYDEMTVEEITTRMEEASDSLVLAVRNYEKATKNRATVLRETERENVIS